ncbi:hypothetical protein FE257_012086 [Aspergillus nanangensis]|uniref:Uncharacterized protein n=1 Tax=Aspergillus nanangensis TaxID=2582783 RepID=A0AAD4GR02_ASPNN|nr:hypothetical protein FE257_012086 [Aspergillus nanangensis]
MAYVTHSPSDGFVPVFQILTVLLTTVSTGNQPTPSIPSQGLHTLNLHPNPTTPFSSLQKELAIFGNRIIPTSHLPHKLNDSPLYKRVGGRVFAATMLAFRDQENLVHAHQSVAASKPLNQGAKQLQPRTPGARAPRTPFKVPLNDENDPLAFGKKTTKGTGKGTVKQSQNTKLSVKDAFMTPAVDPRQRAPLGMKTTNAKAKGLQTPAAPLGTVKPERTTKRGSTQRIKKFTPLVEQSKTEVQDKSTEDNVPDIEYMPPKPKDLPDFPDDITYDTTFPQFQPKNLALGLESVYGNNEVGRDGLTKRERKLQEDSIAYDKMMDEMILKQIESIGFEDRSDIDSSSDTPVEDTPRHRMTTRQTRVTPNTKYTSNISTIRARDAATALSGARTRSTAVPNPKPRFASSMFQPKKPRAPTNPSPMRTTAAAVNSKTTLGYTKGRDMSSKLHGPSPTSPSKSPLSPETYLRPSGIPPLDIGSEPLHEESPPTFEEDEEALNFQLTL